jgi:HD-like signal output (HDOD) protein
MLQKPAEKLNSILKRAEDLPSIPVVALKIYKLCSTESPSNQELEKLIRSDQAVVAKLLRTVNSAYYGIGREVSSIRETMSILGTNGIRNAVMVSASKQAFDFTGGSQLWMDSMEASLIIQALFKRSRQALDDYQFLTGLLHNVGRSVFAKYFPDLYKDILPVRNLQAISEKEIEIWGMDYKEAGSVLVKNWELPVEVVNGIQGIQAPGANMDSVNLALAITYANLREMQESHELAEYLPIKEEVWRQRQSISAM